MIGREMMAKKNGIGFPSSFMLGPQPGEPCREDPKWVDTNRIGCA